MLVSVSFPIRNKITISNNWPIQNGACRYFIKTDGSRAISVGVTFLGVPIEKAPQIEESKEPGVKAQITLKADEYILFAEHDIRAWQSLLTPYILIDIDFDQYTSEYKPETFDEESKIKIHDFSQNVSEKFRNAGEFGILGRAFLAIDLGRDLIEIMSLYREAAKSYFAERFIDAYNNFYLFLESQFCGGRTGTKQATAELMSSPEFLMALGAIVLEEKDIKRKRPLRFKFLDKWNTEPQELIREIVELRGKLRHHTLNSPHRWNPNRQDDYREEAMFLSMVCNKIAFPKTTSRLWDEPFPSQFLKLAEKMHMTITVRLKITLRINDKIQERSLDLKLPQPNPDPQLAQFALKKTLELVEEKFPGGDLISVRAVDQANGKEIFRYDLGSSLLLR